MTLEDFTLVAGTVCHRNGIPFELAVDTVIHCHPYNLPLIRDGFVPEVDGQTFACSQSLQALSCDRGLPPVKLVCDAV